MTTMVPRDRSALDAVRVWLLRGFRVSVGERRVDESAWRLRKAASLIKLLALAPGHCLHRERTMDLLWPELGKKAASNNLRQTLHVARRTLHPDPEIASGYLSVSGEQLLMCPEGQLWVDVEAFEQAGDTARRSNDPAAYRAAIELYSGELLPEDRYEEWAESRRQELRQRFLSLMVELARLYEERGAEEDLAPAVQALQRVLAEEPINEDAHAGLMRLYAASGRRREALQQYERLRETLSRELVAEPATTTRRLRDNIEADRFPPVQSSGLSQGELPDAGKHNLPAPRTSFVGREREMVEIKRVLAMTRLLTLTGAGGSGKTRLALEVSRDLVGIYHDGVWLVELAGLSKDDQVPQTVAGTLGVREQSEKTHAETLAEYLRSKRMLLLLDNCEHLLNGVASLVDILLDSCPHLRVLATSRELLGVPGEVTLSVPTLSVPHSLSPATVEELEKYEAARLFVQRVRHRDRSFALTSANAGVVAKICVRLDGVPLAIELAAARASTLSVQQIEAKLTDALKLLSGGARTATPRQRTIRGALDWSYGLLSGGEKTLFGRLAVFRGGWTLEAAEAVVSGTGVDEDDVLELLSGLAEKSLIMVKAAGDGVVRYRLLEPIRQYALAQLDESGEIVAAQRRHAEYFLALARETEPKLRGQKEDAWLNRLELEHDNVRTALSWSLGGHDTGLGLWLAAAFWKFWDARSYLSEGSAWLWEALAKGGDAAGPSARAAALHGLGIIVGDLGDFEQAERCQKEALVLYKQLEDTTGVAESFNSLGWLAIWRGYAGRAASLFEAGLAAAREAENQVALRRAINGLAVMAFDAGEPERARRLWEEALEFDREQESDIGVAMILTTMGFADIAIGDYERSVELLEEALALGHKLNSKELLAGCLLCLGLATTLLDRPEQAKTMLRESLELEMAREAKANIAENLEALATMAGALGQHVRAARLWGAAEKLREATGAVWTLAERMVYQPPRDDARVRLRDAAWEKASAEGKTMSIEEAVEYALCDEEDADPLTTPAPEEPSASQGLVALSRREEEVAAMVAQGLSNRQIAQQLYLSERTIENHISKILRKLDLASRTEIAAWATQQSLLTPNPD